MRMPRRGAKRRAKVISVPAPTLGWNARDAFEAMKPTHAIVLENMIPGLLGCRARKGFTSYATGMGARVQTVMEYAPPTASGRKAFAAAGASIFDVTNAGPVGAAVATGLTSALFQTTMFSNSAGSFLYLVNGFDDPRYYNGTTFITPVFSGTGFTASNFINVALHQGRLWFVSKGSLVAWYLGTQAVAGALTSFDFGPHFTMGGEIYAIGSWTRDGGNGPDDYFVVVSSEGEALIYSGTDPASASTWQKVGTFRIARPITRRCLVKAGSDLGILTTDGPVSMSNVLPLAEAYQRRSTLTDMISNAFREAMAITPNAAGVSLVELASEGLISINMPTSTGSDMFVLSTDSGGWCLWPSVNAASMAIYNGKLLVGMPDGSTAFYGPGNLDFGEMIPIRMQPAFISPDGASLKRVTMVRPLMQAPASFRPRFGVRVDYDTRPIDVNATAAEEGGTYWDLGSWDVASWGDNPVPIAMWQSASGIGTTISTAFGILTDADVSIQALDIMYEPANPL